MENLIEKYLAKRKKSTAKLAKEVGTSAENLRMIKNNDRLPRVDLAMKIAKALKCSIYDLWIFAIAIIFVATIFFTGQFEKRTKYKISYSTCFVWVVNETKKAEDYNFS